MKNKIKTNDIQNRHLFKKKWIERNNIRKNLLSITIVI